MLGATTGCMHEEIKSRRNSENACYNPVQSVLSSRLLSRNLNVKICRTIILSVVLYGCETWSLTLREGHRLAVYENRVLSRIFGPKRDEVTGEWRKKNNGELHKFYSTRYYCADQIKENEVGRACGTDGRGEKRVEGFGGKARRKKPLERPRRRWEDGIIMDLKEIGWGRGCGMDSPGSGWGPLAGCCECGDEPSCRDWLLLCNMYQI
jgi:hypothetical protein